MRKVKYILGIVGLSAVFFLSGCKSKKVIESSGNLKAKNQNELLDDILAAETSYTSLETKGNFKLMNGNNELKSSAVYKFIKDSIFQISVRPILGTEFFRIDITPDSVFIVDRIKKQYAAEKYSGVSMLENIDFNFYNLQSLLTNQLFYPGKKQVDKKDFDKYTISSTEDMYVVQANGKSGMNYNFAIDTSDRISSTLVHNTKNDFTVQWSYSDFVNENEQIYPTVMPVKVNAGKFRFDMEISYSKLSINQSIKVDRSLPNKYKKIEIFEFLESYLKKK